jgi:hypothetical protein
MSEGLGLEPLRFAVRQYEIKHGQDYTFEAVLADLVDNSIDAGATWAKVAVPTQTLDDTPKQYQTGLSAGKNLYAMVIDNGKGIAQDQFLGAMSEGYERTYDVTELGAFGVGLKASSLSQAYEVTVLSKVKGGEEHFLRLSSCLVKEHKVEKIWRRQDLKPWMNQTRGFLMAQKELKELESGTVVLLEGLHKLEHDIGEERDRSWYIDQIKNRIKDYLGLVFHYYIDGTSVPRISGKPIRKQVDLYYRGKDPDNKIKSLDPFGQKWFKGRSGNPKGTLCMPKKFPVHFGTKQRDMEVKLWLLPHYKAVEGRKKMQSRMKNVRKHAGIADLQGVYVYRNRRLVEFSPERDVWKGMMTKDSHHNYARCEIHLPPCVPNEEKEFDLNTSKTRVDLGRTIEEKLKKWSEKPDNKWHPKDPRKLGLNKRSNLRNGNDSKWEKCKYCDENSISGAEYHVYKDCPKRPTCEICGSKAHSKLTCPKVKRCGVCGSTEHTTLDHPYDKPTPDPPSDPPSVPDSPAPVTNFPRSYTTRGPLIKSKDAKKGEMPTLKINKNHPHYDALKKLLGE